MLEHTSCVGIGGQDMMKTMAITPQKREKTMDCDYLITPFCFYKAWNTYLKAAFGYVWIQYLIDFGENKIQGSQACRILLGSMVGIYWIYALFGGHYCLGRKGCSQNTPQKRKKTMDCDYLITPFCFYKAWNTYLKNWVWICLDSIFDRFCWDFRWFHKHRCWPWTLQFYFWNILDAGLEPSWFYFWNLLILFLQTPQLDDWWYWWFSLCATCGVELPWFHFCILGVRSLGALDFILFFRGSTPSGCTTRGSSNGLKHTFKTWRRRRHPIFGWWEAPFFRANPHEKIWWKSIQIHHLKIDLGW